MKKEKSPEMKFGAVYKPFEKCGKREKWVEAKNVPSFSEVLINVLYAISMLVCIAGIVLGILSFVSL